MREKIIFISSRSELPWEAELEKRYDVIKAHVKHTNVQHIRNLKTNFITAHIPIFFLYESFNQTLEMAVAAGIDDFLPYTCEKEEFFLRIEMGIKRTKRDLNKNPLTKLPGNIAIANVIENQRSQDKVFLHIDIVSFKAYNDKYGFSQGDFVIKKTAELLCEIVEKYGHGDDFLGHIGGDDFFICTKKNCAQKMCTAIKNDFSIFFNGLQVTSKIYSGNATCRTLGFILRLPC